MNIPWQDVVVALLVLLAFGRVVRCLVSRIRPDRPGCPSGCQCPVRAGRSKR